MKAAGQHEFCTEHTRVTNTQDVLVAICTTDSNPKQPVEEDDANVNNVCIRVFNTFPFFSCSTTAILIDLRCRQTPTPTVQQVAIIPTNSIFTIIAAIK